MLLYLDLFELLNNWLKIEVTPEQLRRSSVAKVLGNKDLWGPTFEIVDLCAQNDLNRVDDLK